MITDFKQVLNEEGIPGSAVKVDDWT